MLTSHSAGSEAIALRLASAGAQENRVAKASFVNYPRPGSAAASLLGLPRPHHRESSKVKRPDNKDGHLRSGDRSLGAVVSPSPNGS